MLFFIYCIHAVWMYHRDFLMTKLVQLKRYALTPVVDLINHSSAVESDVSYNYFYGYFAVTTQVRSLVCVAPHVPPKQAGPRLDFFFFFTAV